MFPATAKDSQPHRNFASKPGIVQNTPSQRTCDESQVGVLSFIMALFGMVEIVFPLLAAEK